MNSYKLLKNILFSFDPEKVHNFSHHLGVFAQKLKIPLILLEKIFIINSSRLQMKVLDLDFPNPIGLAAGFDKNARVVDFMSALGFGFIEIGSVSNLAAVGNPQPRLFRLEQDSALINRMGLNNIGANAVLENLEKHQLKVPLGINLVKTNDSKIIGEEALNDFVSSYTIMAPAASYVVLNVSCPNTEDGKTFEEPASLKELLQRIAAKNEELLLDVPLLIKFSSDASFKNLEQVAQVADDFDIDGFVLCNTSMSRVNLKTPPEQIESIGKGGLSGNPIFDKALERVRFVSKLTAGKKVIIGVGGIDSSVKAYSMIKAGASLIQAYTGLIYQGPGFCRRINLGLLKNLDRDGLGHISEAVGLDN